MPARPRRGTAPSRVQAVAWGPRNDGADGVIRQRRSPWLACTTCSARPSCEATRERNDLRVFPDPFDAFEGDEEARRAVSTRARRPLPSRARPEPAAHRTRGPPRSARLQRLGARRILLVADPLEKADPDPLFVEGSLEPGKMRLDREPRGLEGRTDADVGHARVPFELDERLGDVDPPPGSSSFSGSEVGGRESTALGRARLPWTTWPTRTYARPIIFAARSMSPSATAWRIWVALTRAPAELEAARGASPRSRIPARADRSSVDVAGAAASEAEVASHDQAGHMESARQEAPYEVVRRDRRDLPVEGNEHDRIDTELARISIFWRRVRIIFGARSGASTRSGCGSKVTTAAGIARRVGLVRGPRREGSGDRGARRRSCRSSRPPRSAGRRARRTR